MSHVILGLIGVILLIGVAVASYSFIGSKLQASHTDAQAANYLSQAGQISEAISHYRSDRGVPPVANGQQPIDVLVANKYMKEAPPGGSASWQYDAASGAILTPVKGGSSDATRICVAARTKAGISNPAQIFKCDGSNAPGGALAYNDPCCIG